jgi:AcrR family transcriptional regulator
MAAMMDGMTTASAPRSARARARAELTRQIVDTARAHLATEGAAGLSLRAVARDLGMVSSAVYRYVPSRVELLTRLLVEGYVALGEATEQAERAVPREDLAGRWFAAGRAVRAWALAHPHEHALLFGTPVPGYAAPQDTVGPATRVPVLLITVLVEAVHAGRYDVAALPPLPARVSAAIAPVRAAIPAELPDELVVRGLMAWSHLIGSVSFELFGHFHRVIGDEPGDREAYFDDELRRFAELLGLFSGASEAPRPAAGTG